jgi:hypothetical protein
MSDPKSKYDRAEPKMNSVEIVVAEQMPTADGALAPLELVTWRNPVSCVDAAVVGFEALAAAERATATAAANYAARGMIAAQVAGGHDRVSGPGAHPGASFVNRSATELAAIRSSAV